MKIAFTNFSDNLSNSDLSTYLKECGHEFFQCDRKNLNRDFLDKNGINLLIYKVDDKSDFLEIFDKLNLTENHKEISIILSADSPLPIEEYISKIKISDFVSYPIKPNELLDAIESVQESIELIDDNREFPYLRIPIDEFISTTSLPFDIYVRINSSRIIRLGRHGQDFPASRISVYKERGLNFIYVKNSDAEKIYQFNKKVINSLQKSKHESRANELKILNYSTKILLDQASSNGYFTDEVFHESEFMVTKTIESLNRLSNGVNILESLSNHSNWLLTHCYGVSVLSIILGTQLGYLQTKDIENLAMAGLVHDIGLCEIEKNMFSKNKNDFTKFEAEQYLRHPAITRDYLSIATNIHPDIIEIAYYHSNDESTRRKDILNKKTQKLVDILNLADYLSYHLLQNPIHKQKKLEDIVLSLKSNSPPVYMNIELINIFNKTVKKIS